MIFEEVYFNETLIKKLTLDEFLVHRSYQHLWPKLTNKAQRKKRFTQLYKLVTEQ